MHQPLVSILIPVYNASATLAETVDSCLNQEYGNVEIVLVDDSSKDDSFTIAENLAARYKNVKAFRQPNSGACAARNLAFENASGEYIQYLDADDVLSPGKIRLQMEVARGNPVNDIFFCRWKRFTNDIAKSTFINSKIYKTYENPADWLIDSWSGRGSMQTSCWLVHRELIEAAGPWNEALHKNQDGEFFCRVTLLANKMHFVENAIVYYRHSGPGSVGGQMSFKSCASTLYSYELYRKHIRDIDDPALQHASLLNFSQFVKHVYPRHPELIEKARNILKSEGYDKFPVSRDWVMGGVYEVFGFNIAVRMEHLAKIAREQFRKLKAG